MSGIESRKAKQKLRRILSAAPDEIHDAMKDGANLLQKAMIERVPKDSGFLASKIQAKTSKGRTVFNARVGFFPKKGSLGPAYYARFVEKGTKGYSGETIARNGSTRRRSDKIKSDGSNFFGKFPEIKARRAQPFIEPAWISQKPIIRNRVGKAIQRTIKKVSKL